MDYELTQGTKLDYLFFESTRLLEASRIQLVKAQCEQERTQILTVLMLSLENPRLAGYMLTGNSGMFLSTDGSLTWLYYCPEAHSPFHTMNQCYDKIPIFYKNPSVLLIPSQDRLTQTPIPRTAPIASRISFKWKWMTRTPGSR